MFDIRIVEISTADTHALRRAVLRNGDPDRTVVFAEDDLIGTIHLGALDPRDAIVAISSWVPKSLDGFDALDGLRATQLRGMATDASLQGTGIGGLLFETGVQRCVDNGVDLVWARARDSALDFYARHGCTVIGAGFIDDTSGLPHHVVIRNLIG
jgi:GNAT superfamily N-acetyltransferase